MSTNLKFNVGQSVVFEGETVTITGLNLTKKGRMYALSNGAVVAGKELTKASADVEVGVVPETFPLPAQAGPVVEDGDEAEVDEEEEEGDEE